MRNISLVMVSMAPNEDAHSELYRKGAYRDVIDGVSILKNIPDNIQDNVIVQIETDAR